MVENLNGGGIKEGFELNPESFGLDSSVLDTIRALPRNFVELNLPMAHQDIKLLSENFTQGEVQSRSIIFIFFFSRKLT